MASEHHILTRRSLLAVAPVLVVAGASPLARAADGLSRAGISVFDFMTTAQIAGVQARSRRVDVTRALQAAIDSNPGRLIFPPGDYAVAPGEGRHHALVAEGLTIEMIGSGATIVMSSHGNYQGLRMASCNNSALRGLRFVGSGANGSDGAQGLVQIYLGSDFIVENCAFDDANCDGIAIAGVDGVTMIGCSSARASKAGLYINNSNRVRVSGNVVTNFGGHKVSGHVVGAGIQLSGNTDLVASNNEVRDGIGVGILCDNSGANIPRNNRIVRNSIRNVANPKNPAVSSGIRLTNDQFSKECGTVVAENTVRGCGLYSFYVENQDGVVILDNTGIESHESNFVISTLEAATVTGNTAINTGTSGKAGQYAFYLINGARSVRGGGNKALSLAGYIAASGRNAVADTTGNSNDLSVG